eukprot:TRINITY_DN14213_c0_g1_i2.p1 TRINITY_DN14213_c0_g1~~TRINITY_DN14213_c0_g1_i2.p1  ORF type:complete len:587 (+),score=57.56 TRINITY_DN14213_c0_g1_i2:144-1904(+)
MIFELISIGIVLYELNSFVTQTQEYLKLVLLSDYQTIYLYSAYKEINYLNLIAESKISDDFMKDFGISNVTNLKVSLIREKAMELLSSNVDLGNQIFLLDIDNLKNSYGQTKINQDSNGTGSYFKVTDQLFQRINDISGMIRSLGVASPNDWNIKNEYVAYLQKNVINNVVPALLNLGNEIFNSANHDLEILKQVLLVSTWVPSGLIAGFLIAIFALLYSISKERVAGLMLFLVLSDTELEEMRSSLTGSIETLNLQRRKSRKKNTVHHGSRSSIIKAKRMSRIILRAKGDNSRQSKKTPKMRGIHRYFLSVSTLFLIFSCFLMVVSLVVNYGAAAYAESGHALYQLTRDTFADYRKLIAADSMLCDFLATRGRGSLNGKTYVEGVQEVLKNRYQFVEYKDNLLKNAFVLPDTSKQLDSYFSSKNICENSKHCDEIFDGVGTKGAGIFLSSFWERVSLILNQFSQSAKEDKDVISMISNPYFLDVQAAEEFMIGNIFNSALSTLKTAFNDLEGTQLSLVYYLLYSIASLVILMTILAWKLLLQRMSDRVAEVKLYLKIIPGETLIKNKYIRRYLTMTSPETLIGTK